MYFGQIEYPFFVIFQAEIVPTLLFNEITTRTEEKGIPLFCRFSHFLKSFYVISPSAYHSSFIFCKFPTVTLQNYDNYRCITLLFTIIAFVLFSLTLYLVTNFPWKIDDLLGNLLSGISAGND